MIITRIVYALKSAFLLILCASWSACSSESGPLYPNADAFCKGRAAEECQQSAKCPVNKDKCIESRKNLCLSEVQTIPATEKYDPALGEACIQKTREVYTANLILPSELSSLSQACRRSFQGAVMKLGACTHTTECATGLICDKTRCAPQSMKALGELCANPGEICDPTQAFCALANGIFQCVPRRKLNESCQDGPCIPSLRCDTVCKEKLKAADSCANDQDCPNDAPYCDPAVENKCDAGLIFAPGAAACKLFGG